MTHTYVLYKVVSTHNMQKITKSYLHMRTYTQIQIKYMSYMIINDIIGTHTDTNNVIP